MKNKKAEAMIGLTGGEIARLVTAIIAILILIYLIVIITGFYFNKADVNKASTELEEIVPSLEKVVETGQQQEYFVLYAPDWYLFSSEFSDLCDGRFCLCLCKDSACQDSKARACTKTEKFVLIREGGRETRSIKLEKPPQKIILNFVDEKAYPFNAGDNTVRGWWSIQGVPTLFLKFTTEWLWSLDLTNWMTTEETSAKGGLWNGIEPPQANRDFITSFLKPIKNSKAEGEQIFYHTGAKLSEGFYIIEQ
ncbi:MAG: hypothetical protein KKD18_06160 [Nanoarchaeota archaeon]|nr:hypothetical protein [Nanoarchaeota archaeon]MBU0977976.1 hypothetical protein [Nanoarchaeota archaeon]